MIALLAVLAVLSAAYAASDFECPNWAVHAGWVAWLVFTVWFGVAVYDDNLFFAVSISLLPSAVCFVGWRFYGNYFAKVDAQRELESLDVETQAAVDLIAQTIAASPYLFSVIRQALQRGGLREDR